MHVETVEYYLSQRTLQTKIMFNYLDKIRIVFYSSILYCASLVNIVISRRWTPLFLFFYLCTKLSVELNKYFFILLVNNTNTKRYHY